MNPRGQDHAVRRIVKRIIKFNSFYLQSSAIDVNDRNRMRTFVWLINIAMEARIIGHMEIVNIEAFIGLIHDAQLHKLKIGDRSVPLFANGLELQWRLDL